MNLLKLLKVGRSLNGEKTLFGKYKMAQRSLPKFASTVRPSKSAPALESLLAKAKEVSPVAEPSLGNGPFSSPHPTFVTSVLDKTQKIPAGKILRRMEAPILNPDKTTLLERSKNKISSWKNKFSPLRSRKLNGRAPVQTEWVLGQVTVARNDLSDADLELVASKAVRQTPSSSVVDLNTEKFSGLRWIKKTTRFFRPTSPFEQKSPEKTFDNASAKVSSPELVAKL